MNAEDATSVIAGINVGDGGVEDEGGGADGGGASGADSHSLNFSLNVSESLALSIDDDVAAASSSTKGNPDPTLHCHNLRSRTQTRPPSSLSQDLDTLRQFASAPPLPDSQPSNEDEVIDYECTTLFLFNKRPVYKRHEPENCHNFKNKIRNSPG